MSVGDPGETASPAHTCPYCSSSNTTDCGEVLDGIHHVECNACRMAFQVEKETGDAF